MKTMYSPSYYSEDRSGLIFEIIQKYAFATVITLGSNGPLSVIFHFFWNRLKVGNL